jgi:hypothetical protein
MERHFDFARSKGAHIDVVSVGEGYKAYITTPVTGQVWTWSEVCPTVKDAVFAVSLLR